MTALTRGKGIFKGSKNDKQWDIKQQRIREYRREASRLASLANKRVKRLEEKGLQDSPAYQGFIARGDARFGVKGKDHNELQKEVARMKAFINANTSTVRGINTYLKDIAQNTGISYDNLEDLHKKAPKFFELSSKVEQYLRTVEDMASAIGYQKIWESINEYVQTNEIDLSDANQSIDDMIENIGKALATYDSIEFDIDNDPSKNWFKLK